MFSIVASPTFTVPVQLSRPDADQPIAVEFTFRHKGRAALRDWRARAARAAAQWELLPNDPEAKTDVDFLDEIIEAWGPKVVDEHGAPLPYSKAALARLLDQFPSAGSRIAETYTRRIEDARLGN